MLQVFQEAAAIHKKTKRENFIRIKRCTKITALSMPMMQNPSRAMATSLLRDRVGSESSEKSPIFHLVVYIGPPYEWRPGHLSLEQLGGQQKFSKFYSYTF